MKFRLILIVAATFSLCAQAKLEPAWIDWAHPEKYVVDISQLDVYVLAHLLHEIEANPRDTLPLPSNENFFVLRKDSGGLPKRTVPMLYGQNEVNVFTHDLAQEMMERLATVSDARLTTLIKNAVDNEIYDISLRLVLGESNRDDATISLEYLLSDIQSTYARVKISKDWIKNRDHHLPMIAYRPQTTASKKIFSAITSFIAFTATHSADGFRHDLYNYIVYGQSSLETRTALFLELRKQIDEQLGESQSNIHSNLIAWFEQLTNDLSKVKGTARRCRSYLTY